MFGMGIQELLVVLLIVLLLFGAKRLPGIARSLGKAVREIKNPTDEPEDKTTDENREIEG
ncbi:MAG: twin-arginine translocase TatA/TatE family subunit [Elusimicrobiota bacterium]